MECGVTMRSWPCLCYYFPYLFTIYLMSVTHISKICHLLFEAEVHNNAKIKGSIINVSLVPLFICAY